MASSAPPSRRHAVPRPAPKTGSAPMPAAPPNPDNGPGSHERGLVMLPPEIHMAISQHLIYPDALALKHTNRYFYNVVNTGIELKIDWLMERRRLHLECPNDRRCDLGSDLRFCRGSVPLLMQRRRDHLECESRPTLGCVVFGTPTCPDRSRTRMSRWNRGLRAKLTIELRWLLLAVLSLLFSWLWLRRSSLWQ